MAIVESTNNSEISLNQLKIVNQLEGEEIMFMVENII